MFLMINLIRAICTNLTTMDITVHYVYLFAPITVRSNILDISSVNFTFHSFSAAYTKHCLIIRLVSSMNYVIWIKNILNYNNSNYKSLYYSNYIFLPTLSIRCVSIPFHSLPRVTRKHCMYRSALSSLFWKQINVILDIGPNVQLCPT